MANALVSMFESFFQGLLDLVKSFFSLIQLVLESALSFVRGFFNLILDVLGGFLNVVKNAGSFVLGMCSFSLSPLFQRERVLSQYPGPQNGAWSKVQDVQNPAFRG